ncbi:MAG: hypothetical protein IJA85_04605 [Clostridia bacterium]|nr:hypothetical protein [Clostridia bacterium]
MAKYEKTLNGNLHSFLNYFGSEIENGLSVTLEESSDYKIGGVTCAVRIYERYSWSGGNRVSLSLTVVGDTNTFRVIVTASGGSQAMFFKLNTLGEENFLSLAEQIIDSYSD